MQALVEQAVLEIAERWSSVLASLLTATVGICTLDLAHLRLDEVGQYTLARDPVIAETVVRLYCQPVYQVLQERRVVL